MSAPAIDTDLIAMSWPDRLRYAADHDMGVSDLARAVGVSKTAVSRQARRHGVRLTDQRKSAAHAERMRTLNADPEFAAANAERSRARMRTLNADPEFNPLATLTERERADYDTLKRAGYARNEVFAMIGRDDLIGGAA
tara:strand:+ start:5105 stop:5521 length:417 start_codon:yes stop_codon:yes gene_type:complete